MPVRSLSSSVFRWPDAVEVDAAMRRWAHQTVSRKPEVIRVGYFGSYARGDWGVGSDVDIIIIVDQVERSFEKGTTVWDALPLPVQADVLVYSAEEWHALAGSRFAQTIQNEVIWVYER